MDPYCLAYVILLFPAFVHFSVNGSLTFVFSCNLYCPLVLIEKHSGAAVNMDVVIKALSQPCVQPCLSMNEAMQCQPCPLLRSLSSIVLHVQFVIISNGNCGHEFESG